MVDKLSHQMIGTSGTGTFNSYNNIRSRVFFVVVEATDRYSALVEDH